MSPIKIIISFKNWGNSWIIIIHMQHLPLMASIIQTYNRSITTITLIINIIVVETLSNYADCQQIIYVPVLSTVAVSVRVTLTVTSLSQRRLSRKCAEGRTLTSRVDNLWGYFGEIQIQVQEFMTSSE